MGNQWAIHIDIEGFSKLFRCEEPRILESLRDLMGAIFDIGEKCYPEHNSRIRAHQIVDGFTILIDFSPESLEVPIAISIALLRHVAAGGLFAKASIGEGDSGNYISCYLHRVLESRMKIPGTEERIGPARMGAGIMTLFSDFGTAHIDAFDIDKKSPSGSLLTIASSNRNRLPSECIVKDVSCGELLSIDWVHSELDLLYEIQKRAGLKQITIEAIKQVFDNYISGPNPPPKHWINSTKELLNL